jgi:predicted Zn-dependent protease
MFRIFLALIALLSLDACTTSPTSGKKIFTGVVSEQKEAEIGASQHSAALRQFGGVNETQELNEMVAMIGARLAPHAERKNMRWTFTVLNDDMVNAFAVPGGYVYITRGLLALAQDESQVAAVLAHEMGHVNARHSAQQMSQGLLANIGIQAIGIATGSNVAAQLGSTAGDLYLKGYSRSHEHEADALSVKYLTAAGYDPYAAMKFMEQLNRSTQFEAQMAGKAAGAELFSYFSTHPQTPERIVRTKQLADQMPRVNNPTVNRSGYLRAINNTVYGGSGKEGFVRGRDFIHPELKIRFTAPDGFTIKNTPKAVIASNTQGALMIFDTARSSGADAGGFIAGAWAPNAQLSGQENITVNGLAGATAATQMSSSEGAKDARLVALEGTNNLFYRLLFIAPAGQMGNYADAFRRATYSFAHDNSIASISPNRIKVVTVRSGDTVQSMAARMAVKDFAVERFCLLNNLSPNSKLSLGDQVKVVE